LFNADISATIVQMGFSRGQQSILGGEVRMELDEARIRHFICMERRKGTPMEEIIFILHDNNIPIYEISNYIEMSVKRIEEVLGDK
jgi:hypothetical protein